MLKNYFRIGLRNLGRNKGYSIINILGLATGIAVCLMIFLVISFETSFDNFHKKQARIFRVLTEYHHPDSKDIFYGRGVPFGLPDGIKSAFRQIEEVAPVCADYNDQILISNGKDGSTEKFKEERGVFYTTPAFFSIFDFPLLAGSYESLKDPNNALLTKESAEKYFGDWRDAIGKTLKLNNTDLLKVSGILANVPANTDFQFKVLIAYGTGFTGNFMHSTEWNNTYSNFSCYVLLPQQTSPSAFNNQLIAYAKKVKSPDNKDLQTIQPLNAVHYDTQTGDLSGKSISHNLINSLRLIAAFILLIACVNFINLSTAQAINRAKEVGVRKVLGSNKWQLKFQFLSETFLIVFASIIISLLIAVLALPYINRLLELSLQINGVNELPIVLFLLVVSITVTVLAGFYPSTVLSGFNPIDALKSKLSGKTNKGISLRRGLVIFQFIIAQSLIIGTWVIAKQMTFFTNQSLGFDKNTVVNIPIPTDSVSISKLDFLKKQLKTIGGIQNVSFNSNTPVEDNNDNWTRINFDHSLKQTDFYSILKAADNEYLPSYKLPLLAGRNLEASDTIREFLVNEMVLKNLGITNPQDALNKEISFSRNVKGPIVGVLRNFNTRSFRDDLAPLIIASDKTNYNETSIKLDSKDLTKSMHIIEKIWDETYPDFVFEYKFINDKVEGFYKHENQIAQLYKIFAVIAIFLSCLGLYGLASFMAVQRIREVGIRKVLGATGSQIVYLFSKEFILLISIAFAIATPITWYFMHQWLQNYPFRIELSWWIFLAGGFVSVIIALTTVSFQAIKAALANPVTSLRSE
jgi:ABC-type antimicrobial peptide transport system permease subunit